MKQTTEGWAELAATYVRVSSVGQLGRDGDADGYSIPAQLGANKRKAQELGAEVVKAYVERAESARSDDRPILQEMLKELPALGVRYLIVHKVDRLARNRLDDAMLYKRLQDMGITLVSASENIDETPTGRLMHGMLATMAEYFSNNLATEVKKGLHEKHKQGGTPFRAPIGYLHERKMVEGRETRTVVVDEVRAPLVRLGFQLYASGQWPLVKLTAHLEEQGLTSRPTPKRPCHPLGVSAVHKMLTNPYYVGIVEYAGETAFGRHEPLIDKDTFERVQGLLVAGRHGERASRHEHYLRGTIVCAECGGRLIFGRHRGRSAYYQYFSCVNRTTRARGKVKCTSGHYAVDAVEAKVEDIYARVRLSGAAIESIRRDVAADLESAGEIAEREAARHMRRIREIEAKQSRLVQLYIKDLASEDVLKKEQLLLKAEKAAAERLLIGSKVAAAQVLEPLGEALELAADPQSAYMRATPLERRMMNALFFERIEIGPDGGIVDVTLAPVYDAMKAWEPSLGASVNALGLTGPVRPSSSQVRACSRGPVAVSAPRLSWGLRPRDNLGCSRSALEGGQVMAEQRGATGADPQRGIDAVTRYLGARGASYEVLEHRPTYSAMEEAQATHTAPADEAKVVLLRSGDRYGLAVIPASERIDLRKLRDALDETADLRLASEREIGSDFPQFEVGATPPFGPMLAAVEVLDRRLLACDRIVAAGGDHSHSIRLDPREIVRIVDPLLADVCQD